MSILNKYAELLADYCLELKPNDRLFIKTTTLAEPLVREVYREALIRGAHIDVEFEFGEQNRLLSMHAKDEQISHVSPLHKLAMESYDAFLHIRAPFSLREKHQSNSEFNRLRQEALKPSTAKYFERIGNRSLKRTLCQYPTMAAAQEAGMSLEEYEEFVYSACYLNDPEPQKRWLEVRQSQQKAVDILNRATEIKYQGPNIDLTFSTEGRKWINSDGRNNMPSGEVYTSPVEDSVNGEVTFTLPLLYKGELLENIRLEVKDGYIVSYECSRGQAMLENIFSIPGSRYFGEAAIGTNYNIQNFTRNILFDEKIGGTVHLAIGQSYLQAGGKNNSSIHLDMITDMKSDSQIFADGKIIYKDGHFLN